MKDGPFLREWRKLRDLTQEEIADKIGYSQSYVQKAESAAEKKAGAPNLKMEFLNRWAKACQCRTKDLFEDPSAEGVDLELLSIIELWRKMPDASRHAARAMLQGLANQSDQTPSATEIPPSAVKSHDAA